MTFISYSQNFEDVMLWRALKNVDQGFYIDVGANDPNRDSVTKAFYDRGWCGINLEPVQHYFDKLQKSRPRDINLQVAAGSEQGQLPFYEFPDTGLSTLNNTIAERHESEHDCQIIERTVEVRSLTEIYKAYHTDFIHFMNIDVEGAEKQVLEGVDFAYIRPWIILIESTLPNSQVEDYRGWEPILLEADYDFVYFDGLNRFYVAKEHYQIKRYFETPPNYFDGFALSGNSSSSFCTHVLTQSQEARIALDRLNVQLDRKCKTLKVMEDALSKQQAHAQWMQGEWDAAKARIDELARELQVVHQSTSWRITRPFRTMSKISRWLLCRHKWFSRNIIQIFYRALHRALAKTMSILLKSDTLRVRAKAWLEKFPGLKEKLLQLIQANGSIATAQSITQPVDADLNSLTPIAHCIYDDLKTAIALRQKEKD